MGVRLLPLSVSELCAHALSFARDNAQRCEYYASRMQELGEHEAAASFEKLLADEQSEIHALEVASGTRKPVKLSHWEYVWRLAYLPEATEDRPRLVPLNAREALQLTLVAKRRTEAFYDDVSDNAPDPTVRGCAAEMASTERRQLRWIEELLAKQAVTARAGKASSAGDSSRQVA